MIDQFVANKTAQIAADWIADDAYYDGAESWTEAFWKQGTPFRSLFNQLDTTVLLEIACGRGRHSWQIREDKGSKILCDVVKDNIDFCTNRFVKYPSVSCMQTNGVDLQPLAHESISSAFCYDAMVHFDHLTMFGYLIELYRVLQPGGKALLHVSNYEGNPGGSYKDNPSWRNFFPRHLMFDYVCKAGLLCLEHKTIGWGSQNHLDAIVLLQRG